MNAKHTPGPWHVQNRPPDSYKVGTVATTVAWVDFWKEPTCSKGEKSVAEQQANAALIAAAPELLEACRELLKYGSFAKNGEQAEFAAQKALAAIAKATCQKEAL